MLTAHMRLAAMFLAASLVCATPAIAEEQTASQAAATARMPPSGAPAAVVSIGNRHILTLRATNEFGADPADRKRGVEERLAVLLERGGPQVVTRRLVGDAIAVMVDDQLLVRVLPDDADREAAQSPEQVADGAVRNLTIALHELREGRDTQALLAAAGKAVVATAMLAVALWLISLGYGRLARRARGFLQRRSASMGPAWGQEIAGHGAVVELLVLPLRLLAWALAVLCMYEWAALVLQFFPYTRPWGETLLQDLLRALGGFGRAALGAVPDLFFVALIFVITRFIVRLVRVFFDGVHSGRLQIAWIDDSTAKPTGRLLIAVIWLFALVAAYPYLPGSDSEAFKGIGVFVGLMVSIGASGVVNQAVSGLMLMYTRALRPGDFVQIGENEGTVTAVGFLTTRIQTLRHVEVNIPNAVIASSVTRNFTRLAAEHGGVRLPTSVTIGYDTPWRQVQAMLQIAAARTHGVLREPAPRVSQTALHDFYVEYTLLVCVADPRTKVSVLDELHGHIQDVFNEHGVQIMSPNYEADPAAPKLVPPEQWYAAPAQTAPAAAETTAAAAPGGRA